MANKGKFSKQLAWLRPTLQVKVSSSFMRMGLKSFSALRPMLIKNDRSQNGIKTQLNVKITKARSAANAEFGAINMPPLFVAALLTTSSTIFLPIVTLFGYDE
jgi:hypothetical protein